MAGGQAPRANGQRTGTSVTRANTSPLSGRRQLLPLRRLCLSMLMVLVFEMKDMNQVKVRNLPTSEAGLRGL